MAETALYPTVKRFLEAAGFAVKGEVCGCDIVAVREGERRCAAEMLRAADAAMYVSKNRKRQVQEMISPPSNRPLRS